MGKMHLHRVKYNHFGQVNLFTGKVKESSSEGCGFWQLCCMKI